MRLDTTCLYLQSCYLQVTDLKGWWSHRCRMQTVWPDPWRGAWKQHWWSRCSAPLDEPERRNSQMRERRHEDNKRRKELRHTSNSRSVSIWVCSTGMPFSSFSVVMVLITPSALGGNTMKSIFIAGAAVFRAYFFLKLTLSWLWWSQKPSGGKRRLSHSSIVHTAEWMWTCHSLNRTGFKSEIHQKSAPELH